YAQRWEHELYWKQLKLELRKTELLQSHTPHTGAQEIAAMIIVSSLLAEQRALVAAGEVPVLRVSFAKTLHLVSALWVTLAIGGDLLTGAQRNALIERVRDAARKQLLPARRQRSCRRTIRQPHKVWPRTMHPESHEGELSIEVATIDEKIITGRH